MPISVPNIDWDLYQERLAAADTVKQNGQVKQVIGLVIESKGPAGSVGEVCNIYARGSNECVPAEIVGFREDKVLLMPLGHMRGIAPGSEVISSGAHPKIGVGDGLLGRVIDGHGNPIDDHGPIHYETEFSIHKSPSNPLRRARIGEPIQTGIRAIDGCLTLGRGQRMGIFAGSGVGKSSLMGMIARYTAADVNVIGLVGERGREVREFIEKDLGPEGLKRSVVVVATSDNPALVRIRGALVAATVAEFFCNKGYNVMLMVDSVTRLALAQREVGLAIGEPPTTRGYTPSVFGLLPRFLERAGTTHHTGSITGLYTVLVESDDMNEPIADAVRSILDGHIVLSREIASRGHYPAIDVCDSVSRSMMDVVDENHHDAARKLAELVATYRKAEELINIGAYKPGSNPRIDEAVEKIEDVNNFLRQRMTEREDYTRTVEILKRMVTQEGAR